MGKLFPTCHDDHESDTTKGLKMQNKQIMEWVLEGYQGPGGEEPPTKFTQTCGLKLRQLPMCTTPISQKSPERAQLRSPNSRRLLTNAQESSWCRRCGGSVGTLKTFCISFGSLSVTLEHPLFIRGMFPNCKNCFLGCAHQYDEDSYQSICCGGREALMCRNNCSCVVCVDLLVGLGAAQEGIKKDPWNCYMCRHKGTYGLLLQ